MFLPNDVVLHSQALDQVLLLEFWLAIFAFAVFIVYHTHSMICRMLGVPENWIRLLFKMMLRSYKLNQLK
jgi:hypothetical protein